MPRKGWRVCEFLNALGCPVNPLQGWSGPVTCNKSDSRQNPAQFSPRCAVVQLATVAAAGPSASGATIGGRPASCQGCVLVAIVEDLKELPGRTH